MCLELQETALAACGALAMAAEFFEVTATIPL